METWRSAGPLAFCRAVQRDAEPAQVAADSRANPRRVLADAAGEGDHIGPSQLEQEGTQVVANRGDEDFDGQLGTRLAGRGGSLDVAEVACRT